MAIEDFTKTVIDGKSIAQIQLLQLDELRKLAGTAGGNPANKRTESLRGGRAVGGGSSVDRPASKGSEAKSNKALAAELAKALESGSDGPLKAFALAGKMSKKAAQDMEFIVANRKKRTAEQVDLFVKYQKSIKDITKLTKEEAENVRHMGFTLSEVGKSAESLVKKIEKTSAKMDEIRKKSEEGGGGDGSGFGNEGAGSMGGKAANIGKKVKDLALSMGGRALTQGVYETTQAMMKFGITNDITGTTEEALKMGMEPKELLEMQASNRQVIEASGLSMEQFNVNAREAAYGMIEFTGNFRDGAMLANAASEQFRQLGAAAGGMTKDEFANQMGKDFEALNRVTSMTAEQFLDMNKSMMGSQEVRANLFKMDKKRRVAYGSEIRQTYMLLRAKGLEHDAAMALNTTMQGMAAKGPKDRLKEAAKTQALMGAMGMGDQAERMGELMRKGQRRTADEQAEFALIGKSISERSSEAYGGSFEGEMFQDAMMQKTGLDEYFGPNGSFRDIALAQGMEMKGLETATTENSSELSKLTKTLFTAAHLFDETRNTKYGTIVGGLVAAASTSSALGMWGGDKVTPEEQERRRQRDERIAGGSGTDADRADVDSENDRRKKWWKQFDMKDMLNPKKLLVAGAVAGTAHFGGEAIQHLVEEGSLVGDTITAATDAPGSVLATGAVVVGTLIAAPVVTAIGTATLAGGAIGAGGNAMWEHLAPESQASVTENFTGPLIGATLELFGNREAAYANTVRNNERTIEKLEGRIEALLAKQEEGKELGNTDQIRLAEAQNAIAAENARHTAKLVALKEEEMEEEKKKDKPINFNDGKWISRRSGGGY